MNAKKEYIRKTLQQRDETHGEWSEQSECAQKLRHVVDYHARREGLRLSYGQYEALAMITVKMSRILCGDANHADHWDDIAGYAMLGAGSSNDPIYGEEEY